MAIKYIDWTKFSSLITRAMAAGAPMGTYKVHWDTSMGCHKPYYVELASAMPEGAITAFQDCREGETRWLTMDTPCRKCEQCLKNRQNLWRSRISREISWSNRTWMCTFTINPHSRFMFSVKSGSRSYHASYGLISKELTKYLKRLRKGGFEFRYVLVAEAHKDGYPHVHGLVHEVGAPIPKSRLQAEWPHGFTNFKLVENSQKAVFYVSKYLAKDARTRIRASQKYGQSGRKLSFLNMPLGIDLMTKESIS